MKLGLAAAPNAAPVGLFPSAQTPRENLLGAAPFEDQQSLLVSPVPTDDLPNGAGAALSSRGTLEAMGQAVAKAPEQLPDFIDGSRSLASFIAGPEPDEALTKQMPAPGTHFFGGELAPPRRNTFRQATAPLKAIDLSPVTPNFLSSLTVPSMNTRIQQATEALLKKLKLYKADLRIIISVIADFSRSLLPLDFVAVP